jgi:tRNA pseudouridine38-40 synthase
MRYRARVAYHGGKYKGWQIQPKEKTIQGEIEKALQKVTSEKIRIHASGRTDTGVHAKAQVIHFDLSKPKIPLWNLQAALNSQTNHDIGIYELSECSDEFHARYSEHQKTYHYHFDMNTPANPLYLDRTYNVPHPELNFKPMKKFLKYLEGTHDFSSFCSINNSSETTIRTIPSTELSELDDENKFFLSITGKGFLQHMVRIIAGTMIEIGNDKISLDTAVSALGKPNLRDILGKTLPGHGLVLENINYTI